MGIQQRTQQEGGFTVIEVVLFLAVTGALITGVLIGSSVGISSQRYTDAVNSFQATLQEEFVNTTRVANERPDGGSDVCDSSSVGASDCIVVGRLITISASGEMARMNVVGGEPDEDAIGSLEIIKSTNPRPDYNSQEAGTMNWGTTLYGGKEVTIAIIRSPALGENNLSTYVWERRIDGEGTNTLSNAFIEDAPDNAQPAIFCVDPSGWAVRERKVVVLNASASGPNAIEQRVAGDGECT